MKTAAVAVTGVVTVILVGVILGFAISVPIQTVNAQTSVVVTTSPTQYEQPYVTTVTLSTVTTVTSQPVVFPDDFTLQCDGYQSETTSLQEGMDVQFSWSASGPISVTIDAPDGSAVVDLSSQPMLSSTSFHVSESGSYVFTLSNAKNGVLCIGAQSTSVFSAVVSAEIAAAGTSQVVETTSSIVQTEVVVSHTTVVYSTTTCSTPYWDSLGSATCS